PVGLQPPHRPRTTAGAVGPLATAAALLGRRSARIAVGPADPAPASVPAADAPVIAARAAAPEPGWTTTIEHIVTGGRARSYVLVRPPVGAARLAVVVVLHGRGMSPEAVARISDFRSVAGRAILVYPAGVGLSWNAGACCATAHTEGVDDVAFV